VTLRARLVIGLVVLMAVGLTLFGWVLYRLYSDSQYRALNSQLFASVPVVRAQLEQAAGIIAGSSTATGSVPGAGAAGPASSSTTQGSGQTPQAGVFISPGTYGELLDPTDRVVSHVQLVTTSSQPRLPDPLPDTTTRPQVVTVASTHGSQSWRVYAGSRFSGGYRVVVAVPMGQVTSALNHLLLTEVVGGAVFLVVLSLGAWLMLRRGLSPMEKMATTADRISAGDLSQRITPQSPSSEVGKLGLALNGMLDQIESAFAQRDATEARLRQFLSDASHELKTPLTSIQGFAELFRLGSDHVDTATIMRRIESESARMKGLVDDLLLLARLDQIRQPGHTPVDLAVLAADACSDAMATAPDRPVTLTAPQPAVVSGDQDHLRQAVANLVTNAIRHTPAGTPIEVQVGRQGNTASLSVRDHGGGLDEDALIHAFDRFWQKDPARSGAGAGLGLAIVAAVAAEHHGQASAANAPGGGAVFTLSLPATNDDSPPPQPNSEAAPAAEQPSARSHPDQQ
jgi:two-component system, OmpR family, sensor kinase